MNRGDKNVMPLRAVITLLLFSSNLPEYPELSEVTKSHKPKVSGRGKGKRHTHAGTPACTHTHTLHKSPYYSS